MAHVAQQGPSPVQAPPALRRTIGFWGGTAVMVGIIVGSGIFRTPTEIATHLSSPWLIIGLWVAGGVLALLGAFTYAELACMHPESGGVYVFIREGYGPAAAFVFGWTYMLITKPLAAAGIAIVFGEHLNQLLGTSIHPPLLTCAAIIVLTWINARGVTLGTRVAMVLSTLKVAALVAIILGAAAIGRLLAGMDPAASTAAGPAGAAPHGPGTILTALVPVMAAIMWTYDGWSDVGAVAGEVKQPQRTLPRIYLVGTAAITGIYVLVNMAYFGMVPIGEMRGLPTLAPVVAERLAGGIGASLVVILVVISTLGSTHGSIMTGARVTFAQARDGLMFRFLGGVSPRGTPAPALWVQAALSCAAALGLQSFERLAGGFVFSMWIFYGLAGATIFILRARRPEADRPFRCWGYPLTPALFVVSAAAMTVASILNDPAATLPWLGVLCAGWPVYWVWKRLASRA